MKHFLPTWLLCIATTPGLVAQQYSFAPNTANIPYLSDRGDLVVGAGWSRNEESANFETLELYGVGSVMSNLALQADYMASRNSAVRAKDVLGADYYLVEAALGVFENYKKCSASLWVGYGKAESYSYYGAGNSAEFDVGRIFIQPSLSYRNAVFQGGIAMRFSQITHRNGEISFNIPSQDLKEIQLLEKNTPLFRSEIGLQAGLLLKFVLLSLHYTTFFSDPSPVHFVRNNFSISAAVCLNARKKKS
jgi:hypothetical protein